MLFTPHRNSLSYSEKKIRWGERIFLRYLNAKEKCVSFDTNMNLGGFHIYLSQCIGDTLQRYQSLYRRLY